MMRGRRKASDDYETYDAERLTTDHQDSSLEVDYDSLFQQAGRAPNGRGPARGVRDARTSRGMSSGGRETFTNNRGYPAALDGGYASPPMRRAGGGGQFGYVNSSFNGRGEGVLQPNGTRHMNTVASTTGGSGSGAPLSSTATTTFIIPSLANMNSGYTNNSNSGNKNSNNNNNHNNNKARSAPYTKFQVASTPSYPNHNASSTMGPIPLVQLTGPSSGQGLNVAAVDREWERRGSKGSIRSQNSNKSSGGGGSTRAGRRRSSATRFLGVGTESAWTKWSKDRRASYRRRVERLENAEMNAPEIQDMQRVSTPVKKARQEGMKFVHPDLEERYLSADDMNELRRARQQQVHTMRVIEKSRRKKFSMKPEVKLSEEEWHALQEFWKHNLFNRARLLGMFISLLAISISIASIVNDHWLSHGECQPFLHSPLTNHLN
ncbi:endonuclease-reverse transcriptase [Plakobranchus ocellatus]|uniref:Endonuclease-reverse transcriptase n=1 Tax=Plakobranchus ocellatus TaxID=259542 RepID=A0AAV4BRP9_9GAST|nr:endonuclease-reverse transcriptase [Plakobranchus ocellatus]